MTGWLQPLAKGTLGITARTDDTLTLTVLSTAGGFGVDPFGVDPFGVGEGTITLTADPAGTLTLTP